MDIVINQFMRILSETANSDFPHYHYEVWEEGGKCKDGLDMTGRRNADTKMLLRCMT